MEQLAWNQDLLDWLAQDLVTNHYDLKRPIELMLTSQAYQLPAVNQGETASKDFVFRGPAVRRVSAEQFRDALGQLTEIWYDKAEFKSPDPEIRCCFVAADPLAVALGRPSREQVLTTRPSAATTLQGLELTHGETLATLFQGAAVRLVEYPFPPSDLVQRLYRQALGRLPTPAEQDLAVNLLGHPTQREGVEDLLWAMTMLPEFQLIY
jgi:hypothetical protein